MNDPKPFALENGDVLLEKFCTLAVPTESKNAENAWTYIDFVTGDLTEYIDNVTAWSYSINRAYDRNLTVLMLQRQFNFTEEEAESALENFDAIMEKYNAIPTIDDRLYASLYETVMARMRPTFFWSGLRGSNSLPPPWQGGALPDELNPQLWCLRSESNQRHEDFQSSALPTELQRHIGDPDGARTHDL